VFTGLVGSPTHVYLVGASEGGLVTTLAIEQPSSKFAGGLAACGPIGSFTGQVNYWGDFRAVFDYLMDMPDVDVLPGNASNIPASLRNKWDSVFVPRIAGVLGTNPFNTQQLLSVTGAPIDPLDPTSIGKTTLGILWYNVFATNDATDKLGGRPFDNFNRVYGGSLNDTLLNANVKRYKAQPAALAEIAANYETSGALKSPLVTMHTTGDPIVPFWHQSMYTAKVFGMNPPVSYVPISINRYGHCSFTLLEIMNGFGVLVSVSSGQPPSTPSLLQSGVQAETYQLSP